MRRALLAILWALIVAPPAHAATVCPAALSAALPDRSSDLPSGAAFSAKVAALTRGARDAVSVREVLRGNVPSFLRRLRPVEMHAYTPDGRPLNAVLCVMPDYLAIGSDADYLRMPMGLAAATRIAARLGFVLPTPRMVDAIYHAADVQLRPQPLRAGPEMRSTAYIRRHDAEIAREARRMGVPAGLLLAGHKKDLVLSNRMDTHPGRLAIYGWQESNGEPIQPLSTAHGVEYVDYSHGIRLVSDVMLLNGRVTSVHQVLANPRLAAVLSTEGPVPGLARHIPEQRRQLARLQMTMAGSL
ncbi:MAG: hypothetical protein K2Y51_00875 [Gammaproteobacteria bacterium]|nr:hypothetical protein [Gammaproteobacteria bacterium]